MNIILSETQLELIRSLRKVEEDIILGRRDPKVLYKWLPGAFVSDELKIHFKDGIVRNSTYLGTELGPVGLEKSLKEGRFRIVKVSEFESIRKSTNEFILMIENCPSIDYGWFVRALDMNGDDICDLTQRNTMSIAMG